METSTTDYGGHWFNSFVSSLKDCSGEDEKMHILFASWFSVLETSTDDGGHWLNSFDFKS